MKITLDWLLNKSSLSDIKLLTCSHMLSTPITGVNILDNPDSVQWLKSGELILTTGYVFVNDPLVQAKIIKDLKIAGCSGLCLKTKRFFDKFPQNMIDIAEEVELPLIELPYYHSLADISDTIRNQIFLNEFEDAAAEQTLFNNLFNGYFQGKSLNEILQIFSDYIKSSILILNDHDQALWYAITQTDAEHYDLIPPFSSLKLYKKNLQEASDYTKGRICIKKQEHAVALLPFSTPKYTLCILHKNPEELPWHTIMHVLKIIDFSRINTANIRHSSITNYYDSFFQYLMNSENFSETSVVQLCEYYGIPIPPRAICVIFKNRKKEDNFQPQKLISLIKNNLQSISVLSSSYFIAHNQNLICLCLFTENEKHLSKLPKLINETLSEFPDFTAGISRQTLTNLPDAFQEASFMLSLNKYFPEEHIFFSKDYLIFWQISKMSEEEKSSLYKMTVQPLIEFDAQNHTNLTETLWMYFCCHLNSSLASSRLFIHRNTFLKRMEKIKSLLNFSSEHPASLFSYYLGLCIHLTLH